jgi:hypothetical protein
MHIPIGQKGRIIEGEDIGGYVKVVDDAEASGGFLILTSESADMNSVQDSWVIDKEALAQYFHESGWVIEWLSTPTGH